MTALELPDYRRPPERIRERFRAIGERPVVLSVDCLGKVFAGSEGEVTALRDISFDVHRREFVCVIGPSGCGKSTLIRIAAGLDHPTSGRLLLDGDRSRARPRTAEWCSRGTPCSRG